MSQKVTYIIPAMDCISEESQIREALKDCQGIHALDFTLSERKLTVTIDGGEEAKVSDRLKSAGFNFQNAEGFKLHEELKIALSLILAACAEAIELSKTQVPWLSYLETQVPWLSRLETQVPWLSYLETQGTWLSHLEKVLAAAAIVVVGTGVFKKGIRSLSRARLDINALMTVAVVGAFIIGEWPEAAMVASLFALAEFIEAKAVDRARRSIRGLLELVPETAEVLLEGEWKTVETSTVTPKTKIRVRPGARVPIDGVIVEGSSALNQSPVTGESMPVERGENDKVFAGTINISSTIILQTLGEVGESMIDRIINLVETTQSKKAPVERFVDQFARIYTPIVFAMALLFAIFGPEFTSSTRSQAIFQALALLVIACPCALVISTPVAIVSALARSARSGVLMKGGHALEQLARMRALALDKTGTITEGKPSLVKLVVLESQDVGRVRSLGRSLADQSDHPVSLAISNGLPDDPLIPVSRFSATAGRGVEGVIDGSRVQLGNKKLLTPLATESLRGIWEKEESQGRSVSFLTIDEIPAAVISVADKIKDSSSQAIAELQKLNVHVGMLSGDNVMTAKAVGAAVGISDVQGALMPESKLDSIKALQERYGVVGMSGDGINDAPALAQADIGFAMGKLGTDTAKESADVVLMGDDLRKIPEMILLARKGRRVLFQNISFAIAVKVIFIVLNLMGLATMWMAVLADVGASLIVVGNSLTLLRQR